MMVRNREVTVWGMDSSSRFQVAAMTAANKYGVHQVTSVHFTTLSDVYGVSRKTSSENPARKKRPAILAKKSRIEPFETVAARIRNPIASAVSRIICSRITLKTICAPSASQREGL